MYKEGGSGGGGGGGGGFRGVRYSGKDEMNTVEEMGNGGHLTGGA